VSLNNITHNINAAKYRPIFLIVAYPLQKILSGESIGMILRERIDEKVFFAVFVSPSDTRRAIYSLRDLGLSSEMMRLFEPKVFSEDRDLATEPEYQWMNGAILGGVFGLLAGIILSVLADQGVISFRPTRPHLFIDILIIACMGVLGAVGGFLVGIGTPDPIYKRYSEYLKAGGILLSAHPHNPELNTKIEHILEENGGADIHLAAECDTIENLKRLDLEIFEAHGDLIETLPLD
jgi:hypothetical protein